MKTYQASARVTRVACIAVGVIVLLLLPCFPGLLLLYHGYMHPMSRVGRIGLTVAFYCCAPAVLIALWQMNRLLKNILAGALFVTENVRRVRAIRWCCLAVSLICLAAVPAFPALLLIVLIMAFLCLSVTVVGQVMKAGVEIREENDLTV